jgi:uncharacterized protein (TIGR02145 family)
MRIYNKAIIILFLIFFLKPTFFFAQIQNYVVLGGQTWTNVNLSVDRFRNGEIIMESKNKEDWLKAGYRGEPSWCYYMFDEKYSHLGKLYNYYAVISPNNIASKGWTVPSYFDYFNLIKFLDPLITHEYFMDNGSLSGGSLKIKNSKKYWTEKDCKQIDSKFNAIPSGGYSPSLNYPEYDWDNVGEVTRLWCITDWEIIIETSIKNEDEKNKLLAKLSAGKLNEKAIVFRLDKWCDIDADDDPKLSGYSLRLIKD